MIETKQNDVKSVCVYMYTYIYIYTYTHTYTHEIAWEKSRIGTYMDFTGNKHIYKDLERPMYRLNRVELAG